MICSEDGCGRSHHARGLCKMHYKQKARGGELPPRTPSFAEGNDDGFWGRVDQRGECWEWTGSRTAAGYGNLRLPDGRNGYAHRVAYALLKGAIPEGKVIDHLCRNRGCVNPDHLEPVDHLVNVLRGAVPYGPHRTTCRHGHDILDPKNVYQRPSGSRLCRVCARSHNARRARKKETQ